MPDLESLARSEGFNLLSDDELRQVALGNWLQTHALLRAIDLETVARLFRLEANGARRPDILQRLYGRLRAARARHERAALARVAATGADPESLGLTAVRLDWLPLPEGVTDERPA